MNTVVVKVGPWLSVFCASVGQKYPCPICSFTEAPGDLFQRAKGTAGFVVFQLQGRFRHMKFRPQRSWHSFAGPCPSSLVNATDFAITHFSRPIEDVGSSSLRSGKGEEAYADPTDADTLCYYWLYSGQWPALTGSMRSQNLFIA